VVYKYAQENIIIFIIALKEVYKYCHLVVVMVIELLVNSPYNAVMSGRLLEAGHSLLYLYYELLIKGRDNLIRSAEVTVTDCCNHCMATNNNLYFCIISTHFV